MLMNDDDNWEYLTMPAEELQKLQSSFKEYIKSQFKGYVITLKDEVMKVNTGWPHSWDHSNGKDYTKSLIKKISIRLIIQWTQNFSGYFSFV